MSRSNFGRLTTSQFVTAPKLVVGGECRGLRLTTSQFVTAPKPLSQFEYEVWMKECAELEIPLGLSESIEANKRVKKSNDEWLKEHAGEYGYEYLSGE